MWSSELQVEAARASIAQINADDRLEEFAVVLEVPPERPRREASRASGRAAFTHQGLERDRETRAASAGTFDATDDAPWIEFGERALAPRAVANPDRRHESESTPAKVTASFDRHRDRPPRMNRSAGGGSRKPATAASHGGIGRP